MSSQTEELEVQTSADVMRDIPLDLLRVAPWNARKTFDDQALADLTASVQQHGIQVPLIVRHQGAAYEIVAGHRRYRAAVSLNFETAPCLIRNLTDAEAREIGLVDNLQRENLPPIEEANAFAELLRKPGATVENIAATLGKDPSYIGRRLKLLSAIEPVREALQAGAIDVGHALELARLSERQQKQLLDFLNVGYVDRTEGEDDEVDAESNDDEEETEPKAFASNEPANAQWHYTAQTVAALRHQIERTTLRVLNDAPFPLEDEIAPMACTECPQRSSNAALLFNDVAQDTCTDRQCYDGKIRAWVRYSLQHAEEQGLKLLPLSNNYSADKSIVRRYDVRVIGDKEEHCKSAEEAIWIDGEHAGHQVTICRTSSCELHYGKRGGIGGTGGDEEYERKRKEERKQALVRVNVQKRYRKSLWSEIAKATVPDAVIGHLLVDLAQYTIQRMTSIYNNKLAEAFGWDPAILQYGNVKKLREKLADLSNGERLRAAALASHASELAVQEYNLSSEPKGFETLAALFGIDTKALKAAAQEKPKPPAKAKAEPIPKQETKPAAAAAAQKGAKAAKPAKKAAAKGATPKKVAKKKK